MRTDSPNIGLNDDGPGVLILSEFAGSAQSLSGAIRVNPWNTEELANAMHQALSLSRVERELRQHKLYRYFFILFYFILFIYLFFSRIWQRWSWRSGMGVGGGGKS